MCLFKLEGGYSMCRIKLRRDNLHCLGGDYRAFKLFKLSSINYLVVEVLHVDFSYLI